MHLGDDPPAPAVRPALTDPDHHLAGLTGLRGLAAAWVVSFHAGPAIESWLPGLSVLRPITSMGYLGVDLFFGLSGFVLCHRYFDRIGAGVDARFVREFLLLRLARLYPVHVFATTLFAVYVAALAAIGRPWDPLFTARDAVEHLALVQAWWNQPLGWNAPSWSVSLEWLAYLAFPVVAAGLARLGGTRRAVVGSMCVLAAAYAPLTAQAAGLLHLPQEPFIGNAGATGPVGVNLLRLVAGFTGGCATFVLARAWQARGDGSRAPSSSFAATALLAVLAAILLAGARGVTEQQNTGWLLGPPLLLAMTLVGLSARWTRWLASGAMVRAGLMSYSLYMTHWLTLTVLGLVPGVRMEAGLAHRLGVATSGSALKAAFSAVAVSTCFAVGYACWMFVEEPARVRLRSRLVGRTAAVPVEDRARG